MIIEDLVNTCYVRFNCFSYHRWMDFARKSSQTSKTRSRSNQQSIIFSLFYCNFTYPLIHEKTRIQKSYLFNDIWWLIIFNQKYVRFISWIESILYKQCRKRRQVNIIDKNPIRYRKVSEISLLFFASILNEENSSALSTTDEISPKLLTIIFSDYVRLTFG